MSVLVNFRIDEKLKIDMDKVCRKLGITMSAAFNMFAKNLVQNKTIDFSLNKKLDFGINMDYLYDKLDNIQSIRKKGKNSINVNYDVFNETKNNKPLNDDNYYINRVGNIIMLVPKDDPWRGILESSGAMSEDFMIEREQSDAEKREEL
jgi:addiction module RelB/DinJ family antitoxin